MAGYPPNYPPPAGAPFGADPSQQRRFYRDQARQQMRAQREAFRLQRDLYRQQMRARRRSSVLGPLLVTVIGIVLLLLSYGKLSTVTFAGWYGHWWPMLLVAAGVILLAEWAFDQRNPGTASSLPVSRRLGGGATFLLILLASVGASIPAIHSGSNFLGEGFSINPDNIDEFLGEKHELDQQLDEPFTVGSSLLIDNPHGDVTITGKSDDNKVHITVQKQIYSRSDSDANRRAEDFSPRLEHSGSNLSVTMPGTPGAVADLFVTVPDFGTTTVTASRGDVRISGMHAPVTVTANHGEVELNDITAPVTAHVNHSGSSFSAHGLTGDLALRGHAQDITVADVKGQVSLEGDFYGNTHIEHVTGPLRFQTSRTHFSLVRLDGEVDISPDSELTGSQITGPTELRTRSRNISLDRITGDVDVSNSNGSVDLTGSAPLGNVTVDNKSGSVTLTVPEDTGLQVEAETRGGDVEDDFSLSRSTEGDRESLRGSVGSGKSHVSLRTSHADIAIRKGVASPPTPPTPPVTGTEPPPPPVPPALKAHPAKPAVKTNNT